jgi:hypothetical protein
MYLANSRCGVLASAILSLLIAGCSANYNSIYRSKAMSSQQARVTLIDAKQRSIITNQGKFCTEPPPDVFSVFASAFSGNAALGKKADPTSLDLSLAAAVSSAEQGSTIPRTQTINMLNYGMYNTCLRGQNGWIGDLEMPIQAARDQRIMVSLLAIEQLTGVVTPPPVIIGASGAATTGSGGESVVRLDDAWQNVVASRTNATKAETALGELNGTTKECDALATKAAKEPLTDAAEISKNTACVAAKDKRGAAVKAQGDAEGHYAALKEASQKSAVGTASATVSEPERQGSGSGNRATDNQISQVTDAVKKIVTLAYNQDETELFCIRILGAKSEVAPPQVKATVERAPQLQSACVNYLLAKTNRETASNLAALKALDPERAVQTEREFVSTSVAISTEAISQFDAYWQSVSSGANPDVRDPKKRDTRVSAAIGQNNPESQDGKLLSSLKAADSRAAAKAIFEQLRSDLRILLADQ